MSIKDELEAEAEKLRGIRASRREGQGYNASKKAAMQKAEVARKRSALARAAKARGAGR